MQNTNQPCISQSGLHEPRASRIVSLSTTPQPALYQTQLQRAVPHRTNGKPDHLLGSVDRVHGYACKFWNTKSRSRLPRIWNSHHL